MKSSHWGGGAILAAAIVAAWTRFGSGPPDVRVLSATEKENCGLSVEVTEGPYYVSGTGAPKDGNLITADCEF